MESNLGGSFGCAAQNSGNLVSRLHYLDACILSLHDPACTSFGPDLISRFLSTGCTERYRPDLAKCNMTFVPFDVGIDRPLNEIQYKNDAPYTHERAHEIIHAIQFFQTPAYSASLYNRDCNFIPLPKDWVLMILRTEAVAYAFEHWVAYLDKAINGREGGIHTYYYDPKQPLPASLHKAALAAMNAPLRPYNSFLEYYAEQAANWYDYQIEKAINRHQSVEFIKFTEQDYNPLGDIIGQKMFLDDWNEISLPHSIIERLAEQSLVYSLPPRDSVRTFSQALSARGLTPETFLQLSHAGALHTINHCPVSYNGVALAA